jgi:bifunctional DNase/RNase
MKLLITIKATQKESEIRRKLIANLIKHILSTVEIKIKSIEITEVVHSEILTPIE